MHDDSSSWRLLVASLPSHSATARMRIWRSLKTLGCAALRDGAYLLPAQAGREALQALRDETEREGGTAWLLDVQSGSLGQEQALRHLFARDAQWRALREQLSEQRGRIASLAPLELARLMRRLRRDLEALRAIDYFPNEASAPVERVWSELLHAADARLSPGEPSPETGVVPVLERAHYQGRRWATRRRLWVDRVASAWLIRRFIDPAAQFVWLERPEDCPLDALGFDFDGAAFTHVGERVTFEVLLASFDLAGDLGLQRLGALVHGLDVGGPIVPEASGFEAMLDGARRTAADDDALLAQVSAVLDALYTHFLNDSDSSS
ncbi:MAG: chromate resistance protein ChrB domain-containing protein [Gammaproteobacteria bacterium]